MLAIRLSRVGAKKKPSYRVVVIENSRPRDGRSVEIIGHYNPTKDPILLSLKEDRIDYWLSQGARPSETVRRLIEYQAKRPVEAEKTEAESKTEAAAPVAEKPAAESQPEAATEAEKNVEAAEVEQKPEAQETQERSEAKESPEAEEKAEAEEPTSS